MLTAEIPHFVRMCHCIVVAFAYNEQLVEEVPVNEKDAKVDAILMQKELIRCTDRARAINFIA